jgi:hypothetical protein
VYNIHIESSKPVHGFTLINPLVVIVFGFKDDRNCGPLTGLAPCMPYSSLRILNIGSKRANQTVERSIDYMVASLNRGCFQNSSKHLFHKLLELKNANLMYF